MFTGFLDKTQQIYRATTGIGWTENDEQAVKNVQLPSKLRLSEAEQKIFAQMFLMQNYTRGYSTQPDIEFSNDGRQLMLSVQNLWSNTKVTSDLTEDFDSGLTGPDIIGDFSALESLHIVKTSIVTGNFIVDKPEASQETSWHVNPEDETYLKLKATVSHGIGAERFYNNKSIIDAINAVFQETRNTEENLLDYVAIAEPRTEEILIKRENVAELGLILGFTPLEFSRANRIPDIPDKSPFSLGTSPAK